MGDNNPLSPDEQSELLEFLATVYLDERGFRADGRPHLSVSLLQEFFDSLILVTSLL